MDRTMKQSTHQFHKIHLHISKCLACNAEKTLRLKHKKRMNVALQIYKQIYVPILYVTRMTQNKNDSISSILQHGCVVGKNCCVLVQDFHICSCVLDRAN